jgi:hypothetical protein
MLEGFFNPAESAAGSSTFHQNFNPHFVLANLCINIFATLNSGTSPSIIKEDDVTQLSTGDLFSNEIMISEGSHSELFFGDMCHAEEDDAKVRCQDHDNFRRLTTL